MKVAAGNIVNAADLTSDTSYELIWQEETRLKDG